jgi:hypothetical protein
MEPERPRDVPRGVRKVNWTTLALIGALIILALLVAYFASSRNPDQDKLTANELAQNGLQPAATTPEKICASKSTYDLIKRELFRRAAQLRGSDQAAFDQLSAYAVIRMENPVMESQNKDSGAVNCSGSLSLDLPPGVAVVGSRHSLTSDIDYTLQPAADGSGPVVLLRNAEAIVAPLATLARVNQPAPRVTAPVGTDQAATAETNGVVIAPAPSTEPVAGPAPSQPEPPRPAGARPSFDCARARTRSETEVCSDAGLATLDRNMAAQYGRAMTSASPDQRALLRRTRDRFLGYRNRCPNRACIGEAYVGRMREIRDIMEGRWRPR